MFCKINVWNYAIFYERHSRLIFLAYLRTLVNGEGFYHIETQLLMKEKWIEAYGKKHMEKSI